MKEKLKWMAIYLRFFCAKNGCLLINCHAHEIIAAFFGYKSRASLLSNEEFNFSVPDDSILLMTKRISELEGFPENAPDVFVIHKELIEVLDNSE